MKKQNYLFLSTVAMIVLAVISCTKEKGSLPVPVGTVDCSKVSFNQDIKPLVDNNCLGCHSASYFGDLVTYSDVKMKVDNGSLIQKVVTDKTMPPGNPLTQDQIQKFKCWVENGAKND